MLHLTIPSSSLPKKGPHHSLNEVLAMEIERKRYHQGDVDRP